MEQKRKQERRVINIPIDDFNDIKSYCNDKTLDMPKWLVKIAKEKINKGEI